jgi:PTH1 family peptidyl-tRNA hydrolase
MSFKNHCVAQAFYNWDNSMFLIAGLGNPGAEYVNTRHNVGFIAADEIARHYNFSPFKEKFSGLIAEGKIAGEKVFILKPQTYMNLSGDSIVKAALFYKILPQNIIVIHDDIDLKLNQIRVKFGGGAGGHNGLKSIDSQITNNYNRIRIGIGYPQGAKVEVVNHVLSRFSKEEAGLLADNLAIIRDNIEILITDGMAAFSNKIGMSIHTRQEINDGF